MCRSSGRSGRHSRATPPGCWPPQGRRATSPRSSPWSWRCCAPLPTRLRATVTRRSPCSKRSPIATRTLVGLRRARQLALRARDARRPWRGDSAEAVSVACNAALIAGDFDRALVYGLAAPAGEAIPPEAMAPEVLQPTATAAIVLGRRDLAIRLINQVPDPAGQAILLGQLAERDPSTAAQARAAYHRAFSLATDDSQRLEIVQGLAELGEWPLPWLEELRARSPQHAEYFTAMSEVARGFHDQAIRRLRPQQGASLMAAKLLAEVERRAGRIDEAVQTLRAAARRFDDPHSLASAAMILFEAGRKHEAR